MLWLSCGFDNFEQVNTLKVTKFISTRSTEFGKVISSFHLTCVVLSSIPFCETQGGKAASTVWLHPGYPAAVGRIGYQSPVSVGEGGHTKAQVGLGVSYTSLWNYQGSQLQH